MTIIPKKSEIEQAVNKTRKHTPHEHDFKVKALILLKDNNMDIGKTAKELGIKPALLSRWKYDLGKTVYKIDDKLERTNLREINHAVEVTRKNLLAVNNEILEESQKLQLKIMKRLWDIVEENKNVYALTQSMAVLNQISSRLSSGEFDGKLPAAQTNTFTQIINQQVLNLESTFRWKEQQLRKEQNLPPLPPGE